MKELYNSKLNDRFCGNASLLLMYPSGRSYQPNTVDGSVNFTSWLITNSVVSGHLECLDVIRVALRLSLKSCLQRCNGMFGQKLTSNFHHIIAVTHT